MAGVSKIEIRESEAELKELLRQEKTGSGKERIQVLYLLKTKKAKTVTEAAEMIGRNRVTVQAQGVTKGVKGNQDKDSSQMNPKEIEWLRQL
jgi:hypothetical protein